MANIYQVNSLFERFHTAFHRFNLMEMLNSKRAEMCNCINKLALVSFSTHINHGYGLTKMTTERL